METTMSRTKILTATALVALGTSCLISTEASARFGGFAHAGGGHGGGHARFGHSLPFTRPMNVAHPTNVARPVNAWHPVSFGPSALASHGSVTAPVSQGLAHVGGTSGTVHNLLHFY